MVFEKRGEPRENIIYVYQAVDKPTSNHLKTMRQFPTSRPISAENRALSAAADSIAVVQNTPVSTFTLELPNFKAVVVAVSLDQLTYFTSCDPHGDKQHPDRNVDTMNLITKNGACTR
jgi:hypothetical protein